MKITPDSIGLVERFAGKFNIIPSGCWEWQAHIKSNGYGEFYDGYVSMGAHRWIYQIFNGVKLPASLVVDHLCRNRACVNPRHLEAVTFQENSIRGARYRKYNERFKYA